MTLKIPKDMEEEFIKIIAFGLQEYELLNSCNNTPDTADRVKTSKFCQTIINTYVKMKFKDDNSK